MPRVFKYVQSEYEAVRMEYSIYILLAAGIPPPHLADWGSAPEPEFLHWHQVPIRVNKSVYKIEYKSDYNFSKHILMSTDTFLLFYQKFN